MIRRSKGAIATTIVLACGVVLAGTSAASADPVSGSGDSTSASQNGGTLTAEVEITITGDVEEGKEGYNRVSLPARCWWGPASADGAPWNDAVAMYAWFLARRGSSADYRLVAHLGSEADYKAAAEGDKAGGNNDWYRAYCRDISDLPGYASDSLVVGGSGAGTDDVPVTFRAYDVTAGPPALPAAVIDPIVLAEYARDAMYLPIPDVERNPKATKGGLAGATFVGLPTWFWVENEDSVGFPDGIRYVRAETATAYAQVTAVAQGLRISAPTAEVHCSGQQATTPWGLGSKDDADACKLSFPRASVAYPGGYPVTATAEWNPVTWEGSGGSGGTFDAMARQENFNVPVAESQAVVISAK